MDLNDITESLHDADEVLRLSENKPELQAVYAEAERFKGISLHHLGQIAEAARVQEDALQRYQRLGEEQRAVWVWMELGMTYRASGNYLAARDAYEHALTELRRENNLPSQADVLNSLGVLYHDQGEYEQAVRAFETGLECARYSGSLWQESFLLASLGDTYTDLDEYESANQAYLHAAQVAQRVGFQFLTNYLSLAQARLARLRGQVKEAHRHLLEIESLVRAAGSNFESGLFHLERGCLH